MSAVFIPGYPARVRVIYSKKPVCNDYPMGYNSMVYCCNWYLAYLYMRWYTRVHQYMLALL